MRRRIGSQQRRREELLKTAEEGEKPCQDGKGDDGRCSWFFLSETCSRNLELFDARALENWYDADNEADEDDDTTTYDKSNAVVVTINTKIIFMAPGDDDDTAILTENGDSSSC